LLLTIQLMNKLSIILVLLFCFSRVAYAQRIRMLNSTEQKWYGGVAGKSGANYVFLIEFADFKTDPIPDTIWIEQQPVPLSIANGKELFNTKITRTAHAIRFEINVRVSKDDYEDRHPIQSRAPKATPHAPITYEGVALLSYRIKGAPKYFEIRKIMKEYPAANYP